MPMREKIYVIGKTGALPGLDFNTGIFFHVFQSHESSWHILLNTWNVNRDYRVAVSVKGVPEGRVDYAISAFCG